MSVEGPSAFGLELRTCPAPPLLMTGKYPEDVKA